jgi:nicotinamide mononucleotide (NMN) deamidase PncC
MRPVRDIQRQVSGIHILSIVAIAFPTGGHAATAVGLKFIAFHLADSAYISASD